MVVLPGGQAPFSLPASAPTGWRHDVCRSGPGGPDTRLLAGEVAVRALLVRDVPTAEDVVHDSFIAMRDAWDRLGDADPALAYLRQAVVNRSRSILRHRTAIAQTLRQVPPDTPHAEDEVLIQLERSNVVAALRKLPVRQREAIVLRYYADLSEAEIAAAMGITRGAVKSHTARGMSALRAAMQQEPS
jgi:RNA polymerase sigma-70 factor (sigma-E family)